MPHNTSAATDAARAAALKRQKAPRANKGAAGLGARLLAKRLELGLSQADVAERADVAQRTVANMEAGEAAKVSTVEGLAKALGCSPEWLAYGHKCKYPGCPADEP